ncbi:MAG TPA: protein phosphatase 2C domain-containing protein [Anaerolineales bacterium]
MIPAERAHLHVAAQTHPGMSGKNNEDRYAVSAYQLDTDNPLPSVLAVISDGIGGHRAGEVAAEIAVETISQAVAAGDPAQPVKTLYLAVLQASQAIYDQSESDIEQKGMGATCACCWVIGSQLYTVTVGDSRIYLLRGRTIQQLSTDHTWIQEAIEQGALTPNQARNHPNAHVIRRYLGSRQPVVPDFRLRLQPTENDEQAEANQGFSLLPGDQVILCSDGLTDLISNAEIIATFTRHNQEEAIKELVDLANQRGGHDNITVVALLVPETAGATLPLPVHNASHTAIPVPAAPPRRVLFPGWACLGIGGLLVLVAVLAGGLIWFLNPPVSTPVATRAGLFGVTPTGSTSISTSAGQLSPTASPFIPASLTPGLLPVRSATPPSSAALPTLTPWPTNTLAPRAAPTGSPR